MNLIDKDKLIEELKHFHWTAYQPLSAHPCEFEDAMNIVERQPIVNDWIPVERELPERYEWVLVAWEEHSTGFRGIPQIAELRRNECWGFQEEMPKEYLDDLDVIAWKPIEPYEANND